jgi:hypothetical protein
MRTVAARTPRSPTGRRNYQSDPECCDRRRIYGESPDLPQAAGRQIRDEAVAERGSHPPLPSEIVLSACSTTSSVSSRSTALA